MLRSDDAGSLRAADIGRKVRLAGWVARRRDHGGVAFIDLRDASGSVQVVISDEKVAGQLRAEWCVLVEGEISKRPEGNANSQIPTGEIEVRCEKLTVLSEAAALPFPVDSGETINVSEEVRYKYRYLDLRREGPAANLRLRSKITSSIRKSMDELKFLEIETPAGRRLTPPAVELTRLSATVSTAFAELWCYTLKPAIFRIERSRLSPTLKPADLTPLKSFNV